MSVSKNNSIHYQLTFINKVEIFMFFSFSFNLSIRTISDRWLLTINFNHNNTCNFSSAILSIQLQHKMSCLCFSELPLIALTPQR